jgi:hypothetical protein
MAGLSKSWVSEQQVLCCFFAKSIHHATVPDIKEKPSKSNEQATKENSHVKKLRDLFVNDRPEDIKEFMGLLFVDIRDNLVEYIDD